MWEEFSAAYEDAVNFTATRECPWYVLPADQKWYTRYLVSEAILKALREIDPHYPELTEEAQKALPYAGSALKAKNNLTEFGHRPDSDCRQCTVLYRLVFLRRDA